MGLEQMKDAQAVGLDGGLAHTGVSRNILGMGGFYSVLKGEDPPGPGRRKGGVFPAEEQTR